MLVTCTGIIVVDLIAADLPKISDPGELTYTERSIEVHIGGHAANVSIDLMKLGMRSGEVSIVGAVGRDLFGDYVESVLAEYNVVSHLQRIEETGTSKDLILVVRGEDRRYHADIGANKYLSRDHVLQVLNEERPLIFYVGGVGLLGRLDRDLPEILRMAKERGCITFIDPVAPYKSGWNIIVPSLRFTDIFHCNGLEAKEITGKVNPDDAIKEILDLGVKLAIISLGEEGVVASTREVLVKMPAFDVPTVDPTGAGDAFCAGIIHNIIRKMRDKLDIFSREALIDTLMVGEASGAACVTMVGTTTGVTESNVRRLIEVQGRRVLEKTHIEQNI